jgi:hypothetical protein
MSWTISAMALSAGSFPGRPWTRTLEGALVAFVGELPLEHVEALFAVFVAVGFLFDELELGVRIDNRRISQALAMRST